MSKKDNHINRFIGALEKFVPEHLLEADMDIGERVRLRTLLFMVTANLSLCVLIALPMLLRFPFSSNGKLLFFSTFILVICGQIATLLSLRYSRRPNIAGQVILATFFGPFLLAILMTGGITSPVMPLLLTLPVMGSLLSSHRVGTTWTVVVMLACVSMAALQHADVEIPQIMKESNRSYVSGVVLTLCALILGIFVTIYEMVNRDLRRSLALQSGRYEHLSKHDALTQLPNRRFFEDLLLTALQRANRTGQNVGLLVLDLDGFKQVNDNHGHVAGDELLQKVAERLRTVMRSTDAVARLGGDEFAIIAENIRTPADLDTVANNIKESLNHPFELAFGQMLTGVSIGGAVFPDSADDNDALLLQADNAMYHAKHNNMGHFIFADAAMVESLDGGKSRMHEDDASNDPVTEPAQAQSEESPQQKAS